MMNPKQKQLVNRLTYFGVFLAVVGGIFLMGSSLSKTSQQGTAIISEFLPANDNQVLMVEFSDFQCPACGAYYPLVERLKSEYGDRLIVDYRHFPLRSIHKNAEIAAKASEAARLQGAFEKMEKSLFENQDEWSGLEDPKPKFISYAESFGLDRQKFISDMSSDAVAERINRDVQKAYELKINGTPTFFVNGKKISNPASYDGFKSIIEQALGQ